ncbi:hypothetical protein BST61_g5035 [Cercospora zeina]
MAASYVDRIVGSARDLSKSAFSGIPGIEAEIQPRDFFGLGGKRAGESGPSYQSAPQLLKESRVISAASGSFRNCGAWDKDVESDYQDFMYGSSTPLQSALGREGSPQSSDGAAWDDVWKSKRSADARRSSFSSHDHAHSGASTPIFERRSDGKVVYQDDGRPEWRWRHEWKRINKHLLRERLRQESRTGNEINFELDHAARTDVQDIESYNMHSAALARLQQLKQHLMSIKPVAEGIQSWTPDWEMQQHERCDWTVEREYDRVTSTPDEPAERYYFTCELRGCHHRLLRQTENLTLEIRQRVCVHDDCGIRAGEMTILIATRTRTCPTGQALTRAPASLAEACGSLAHAQTQNLTSNSSPITIYAECANHSSPTSDGPRNGDLETDVKTAAAEAELAGSRKETWRVDCV